MTDTQRCNCCERVAKSPQRRKVIQLAASGLVSPVIAFANSLPDTPEAGDFLVEDDAEGTPTPPRMSDLRPGKPLLAFPYDAKNKVARNASRLNKLVLMRFTVAELDAATRSRAADGVVAYSAVCTHQGCDTKTWIAKEKALVCFCHSSKFAPLEGATVISGPASRALPALPLALDGELLVVAGAFTAPPGGSPA